MKIEDIYPEFIAEVAGCPDEVARMAVAQAFQELCMRAKVWSDWFDDITLVDGQSLYELDAIDATTLTESALEVWLGNLQLTPITLSDLSQVLPEWATQTSNQPRYFNTPLTRQTVTVYPTPLGAELALRVKGVFIPKRTITSIPDNIALYHMDTIVMGAKGRLMLQAKQLWSDAKLGDYWTKRFKEEVEKATINNAKGNVTSSDRVRPRAFGY